MRTLFFVLFSFSLFSPARAAYDSSWYRTQFWSGEYPDGFSVVKQGVAVPARPAMDKALAPSLRCALPYRAVFQPWNGARNARNGVKYFTASKIVPLKAKEDFEFQPEEGGSIRIAKGDTIEFLIYGAEGSFTVRFRGKNYTAGQDLYDHVETVPDSAFVSEEWLSLTCTNGVRAWILVDDLGAKNADGERKFIGGIAEVGPGLVEYGKARDLTEAEARQLAR